MSASGFRGRGLGPRGTRSIGPSNGFSGPRFPHPTFNGSRPPQRLPGSEKWVEAQNFVPWQQNKNFIPRSQYRAKLPFRPNSRGRAINSRGIVRFSGPGRPLAHQFCKGFARNSTLRTSLPQEEQIEEKKSVLVPQIPLLGSEEERQQKITETADKLKQKLSSITEEDLTNFWEDDLSFLPNNNSEKEISSLKKGIPELKHDPPELDLTFTDFRDIGRVDCNNPKFDRAKNRDHGDDIIIAFESKATDKIITENDDVMIINESDNDSLNVSKFGHSNNHLNQSNTLLESDGCQDQMFHELSNSDCNLQSIDLQSDNISEYLQRTDTNTNTDLNLDENIRNVSLIQPINDLINENSLVSNDLGTIAFSESILNDRDVSQADLLENQSAMLNSVNDAVTVQDTNVDATKDDHLKNQTPVNTSDSTQTNLRTSPSPNEEIPAYSNCDSKSSISSSYDELHKSCNLPGFQLRLFNVPPRFSPRIPPGPRCRWTFQEKGKNLFFRGPQRLPFHGNRMPPTRHTAPFETADMSPVTFGSCGPQQFTHNVPVSSHDSQHHALVPFSSSDLPPAFDPSEPPPNIRSMSVTESSTRQEATQSRSLLDTRSQITSVPSNNLGIMQSPLSFDLRGPPPGITLMKTNEKLLDFDPQQPPPKIHKRDELLQPPPIFDPRLSSQERSKLIAPLNASGSHMIGTNLMESSQISDFNVNPVAANFSQPPPFVHNLPINYQPVLPQANNGQTMLQDFVLPPPPMNIADVPPPPLQEVLLEKDSSNQQGISMDDGLEDMQEAMEFAKQIMNMSEEMKSSQGTTSALSEAQYTPSEIPVPKEDVLCISSANQQFLNCVGKKQKKKKKKKKENKSKKGKPTTISELEHAQKPEENDITDEEHSAQNKTIEDVPLTIDQIRPKVIFNLSSKTKVLQKPEEWHRPSVNISKNREISQQVTRTVNSQRERRVTKKHLSEHKRNNQTKTHQKEHGSKINWIRCANIAKTPISEKSNDMSYNKDQYREKPGTPSLTVIRLNNIGAQKGQNPKKENRKLEAPTSELSWKNRVINRFLKMSKNDICNMVNNSSLRKFDIAMKHLVKERRSSLSLKMRNTEDEKMKEYDREEFMNQLNAMLDPGAVVGITDLPTEFIHHLSEVLQLDPMPPELGLSEKQKTNIDEVRTEYHTDNSRMYNSEYFDEKSIDVQSFDYQEQRDSYIEQTKNKSLYMKEEPSHYSLTTELTVNPSREKSLTSSSRQSPLNKSNTDVETMCKKQQPLFNEADLDDILSQVTERTRSLPNVTSKKFAEMQKLPGDRSFHPETEAFERNTFVQISNATAADLDDIFSAGIARAKSLGKNVGLDISRARKSSSEDRNTFRSERYERWSRKERDDLDSFRNLTKEEWEAKYGTINASLASDSAWKTASNSAENLSRTGKSYCNSVDRYCPSDSPTRNLSLSPVTHDESPLRNQEKHVDRYSEIEESRRMERSESSNDHSTSSSSDTDEETVATNVTKLLKVIKEKEKIAKKRSLNETIRDEVTAEIEKKWKEKNKYQEHKSRKRERRKRDRKEKRKREKKRRRKSNSHSNTSRSSEYSEEFRLLAEDEIKKEVTIKEEPLSTFEDSISQGFNNESNKSCVDPIATNTTVETNPWLEFQSLEVGKQQVPAINSDNVSLQPKKKLVTVSVVLQPKTKAQLKQMPDPNESEQNQIVEKSNETDDIVGTGSVTVTDVSKTKENVEEPMACQLTETNKEFAETPLYTNNAPLQVVEELSANVIGYVNVANTSDSCTHLTIDAHTANRLTEQKSTGTVSSETRSGYKKIDIKAYKERALQKRLQEEAKLKDNFRCTVPTCQEMAQSSSINQVDSEIVALRAEKEVKMVEAGNDGPPKDPRLTKIKSSQSVSSSCIPSYKIVNEKTNFEEEHQCVDISRKSKELFISVQRKVANESSETRIKVNLSKDPVQPKNHKNDDDPASLQERIVKRETENLNKMKISTKTEVDEKRFKKLSMAEYNKFKNIRSEGSKELKLRKEKKSTERKTTKSKVSTKEKDLKHPQKTEQIQKSITITADNIFQVEAEKINNNDTSESLQSRASTMLIENLIVESYNTSEINKEHVGTNSTTEEDNNEFKDDDNDNDDDDDDDDDNDDDDDGDDDDDDDKGIGNQQDENSVNKKVVQLQQVDQEGEGAEIRQKLLFLDIEQNNGNSTEINSIQCQFSKELKGDEAVVEQVTVAKNLTSVLHDYGPDIYHLKKINCFNNGDDLRRNTVDNNTILQENKSNHNLKADSLYSNNLETEIEGGNQDNSKSIVQTEENMRTLRINKVETSEIPSPDSSGSPFKGFFAECIEGDLPQESQLCKVQMKSGDRKESSTKDFKQCFEVGTNDQPNVKKNKMNNDDLVEEIEDSDGITLTRRRSSIEEQPGTIDINVVDKIRVNKVETSEIQSPDSSGSPFKGFFVESIEGDLPQESQLCTVQMKTGDRKKSSTKDFKQCFEVGTNDQPNVKKTKMNNDDLVEEIENSVGITLTRRRSSIEKQPDTIEADIKQLKTEHANTLKGPETDVISHNRCCQDLVSRDKFDEGEESFIVLDEYIHDTEGRSLEKLNHYNLDLEECIARDTNTVVNTLNQGEKYSTENFKSATFDSTDLKELSDFDKSNGASVGIQNKMKTNLNEMSSESLEEEISKVTDVPSDLNKTSNVEVDEIESLERSKLAIPTDKEDFPTCSRRDAPVAEDIPRQYSLHKISHSAKTVSVAAFKENIKSPESNGEPNSCDKNNVKKQNKVKIISISSNASKMSVVQDVSFNIATEQEKLHKVRDTIQTTDAGRTNQKEENEALHKLKDKPKMKYKLHKKHSLSKNQIKEAVAADTVKLVSAKEAIMNRMIEIDVEIHKLMTEKMTLYQMLTSDALPMGNDVEQNDTIRDDKESKKTLVRPRTPSALMSQLIQNIETEPVSNQCAKTTAENALLKDSTVNSVQINKSKTYGYEQHFEKITNNVSTCSSENEEAVQHRIGSPREFSPSAKKKRHHGPERAVKWDNEPESMKDMLYNDTEGKQANNVIKPILKKVCSTRESTEKDTSLAQTSEVKSRKSCGNMSTAINSKAPSHNGNLCTFNEEENEKTEFRNFANEFNKTEASEQSQNKILDDANDANTSSPTKEKTQENRTPDRSSIYSDDSTWDSLPQVASDDQRKHGTGLALLEETYRKEMAKTRKMKAETRRKKKKKETRAPFQSAVPLTSEEEELPLSALYVKKLHANKKDNMVDQPQERANNDQRVWKNVVEVINAVAENRLGDLSMKNPVKRLGEDSRINVPDANDTSIIKEKASGPKSNIEPKQTIEESREIVVSVPLTSIEDNCTQHTKMSTCFDDQIYACNYARITPSLNKILVLANNGEQLEQSVMNTELQNEETLSATSTNTVNVTSESVSQSAENRNLEISQITFNSAAGSVETGVNDVLGDQCLNTSEVGSVNVDRTEEIHMDDNSKEFILRAEVVGIHKITFVNPEETVTLSDVPNRNDNATAETGDSNLTTRSHTPACNLNKNSNYEYEQANKELFVNTSLYQQVCCDKEGAVDNPEHLISLADDKMTKKRRESERSNKSLSEENNNRNRTPVSILVDVAEALQNDEASNRKPKRKRGSSRIPLRRSSRYTEEVMKRIKLEIDTSVQSTEQESSERNIQTPFSSISPTSLSSYDEDTESVSSNGKKSRNYKTTANKKRSTQSDIEILSSSSPSSEDLKDIVRRCKQQHTMPEMMNCKVRLVDSKHTILKPNVDPNVLRKYGISTINLFVQSAPNDRTSHPCIMMESMAKDLKRVASTLTTELSQCHMSKLLKKTDDATRSIDHLASFNKVRRGPRSMKMNFLANDKETTNSGDDPSVEVMQISTKEQVVVDISQGRGKPDVEIVEEKTTVTKSQHQNDSESILAVIETKDDKEIPRTQYTVHKGPILDIKVFEKSFLAASEDGRIYRYSQASNGILNIYKGHKAAVTCLYVYNSNSTDVNKEWMFSGSLDGTLRCYNITTGVQLRDTADIGSPIQCMDEAWGIIFIGTKSGHVSRYHIKSGVVKGNSIQFSDQSVLALKATNEGPRRVLIVASRSQPITIRDAQTGLFLRTISGEKSHTVYSLMRDHNLIYCGTSTTSILVFDFTNGEQIAQHDAGVGIVCMRLYKKLLFAGCYDGNIYIFDTKDDRLICSIPGPGNMLLSMEVIDNKIIAGSKDKRLQLWQMTRQVRALL